MENRYEHNTYIIAYLSIQVIKKELGMEKDDTDTIIEKYTARIAGLEVPESTKTVIDEEINKLR